MDVTAANDMPMTNDNDKLENLRRNLRRLRDQRGWSQVTLEEKSGVSQSTISRIEGGSGGRTSQETIEALAAALNVPIDELLAPPPAGAATARATAAEQGEAKRGMKRAEPPDVQCGVVDMGELLRVYISSHWYTLDNPSADEMRWLASIGKFGWEGAPPTAETVHVLLEQFRGGTIR